MKNRDLNKLKTYAQKKNIEKENGLSIETEDHYWTYAAVATRHLNAEERTVCFSGRGLYRNNTGSMDGTLPELFPMVSPNTESL